MSSIASYASLRICWSGHGWPMVKNWCQLKMLTSTKPQSPLGDSTLANLSQWLLDSDLGTPSGKTFFSKGA